jgi:hypothetical protein
MTDLLLVLTPISLADSLSVVPMCIVPLAILLAGRRPLFGAGMFIAGVVIPYYGFGVLVAIGLDQVFDRLHDYFSKHPDTLDLALQIAIGMALVFFGYRMAAARQNAGQRPVSESMTPSQGFALGFGLTVAGSWGAFPYFAAVDQILKADLSTVEALLALLYYNLLFVSIPVALVVIRVALGKRADGVFDAVKRFSESWGRTLIVALLLVLGVVLIADGVGCFFERPLIPFP